MSNETKAKWYLRLAWMGATVMYFYLVYEFIEGMK